MANDEIEFLRKRVVALEERMDTVYRHLGLAPAGEVDPAEDPRIIALLREENVIEAIKVYRQLTNTGLATAKAEVEKVRNRLGL